MAEADPVTKIQKSNLTALEEGHLLRSRFLDATALLESHLAQLMSKLGLDDKLSVSLGHRLTELSKTKHAAKIERIRSELMSLSAFRAKVAHSRLSVFSEAENDDPILCFSVVPIETYDAAVIPVKAFRQVESRVKHLANQLKQMADEPTQPKAPTPTSPAAPSAKALAR